MFCQKAVDVPNLTKIKKPKRQVSRASQNFENFV